MRYILFFLCIGVAIQAQVLRRDEIALVTEADTLVVDNGEKDSVKIFKPTIEDYRYRTQFSQSVPFDTTFAVRRSYIYTQYNNEDNFGKIPFANIGSGFQKIVYSHNPEANLSLLPERKSHFIIAPKDVKYFDVKTPTTSFVYHNAMRNGAALQTTYTQNVGKNLNISVQYMGLRSQGFYTNGLSANNTVLFSAHYQFDNQKYEAFAHFIHQNVNDEEYGGIADLSLFRDRNSEFKNRQNLEVNLTDSYSQFSYRRWYFSQNFAPFNPEKYPFRMAHTFAYQSNRYGFNLGSSDFSAFESVNPVRGLSSYKYYKNLSNIVSLVFDNQKFKLDAGVRHQHIIFGAGNPILNSDIVVANDFTQDRLGALGNLNINLWEKFQLQSHLEFSNGKHFGNFLRSANQVKFEPIKDYFVNAKINWQNSAPSLNYLLNISPIADYNYNFTDFKNENILEIGGTVGLKWFKAQAFANYFRIDNYAYFDADGKPKQSSSSLNISQIGGEATFDYRKFHLNTRLLFQSNLTEKELLPAPNFVARANVYWQDKAFKKAAEVMIGIKAYYFSKLASRDFSPVISEFVLPNSKAYGIGGQPVIDAYFNMKVKTMQFFIEAQNFTTIFIQNETYTAPYYPIYDFRLNIGIVWNMFH